MELTPERLEYYKKISENLETYGSHFGEPDKESGRAILFDDRRITSFFNEDKTGIIFQIFIQDHITAGFSMSIKAAYFLMRLIDERLCELNEAEGRQ